MNIREYDTTKTNSWNKSNRKPSDIPKEEFIKICNESESMSHACSKLGLHFGTFKKYASLYGCYLFGKKGNKRKGKNLNRTPRYKTENILKGEHPHLQTGEVKRRLLKEGIKKHICEKCELIKWNNLPIPLELNHKDGNRFNHNLENLELLCPNCHAQTDTYRGKNK
jgi:5-methylcytosine-specific restriction endonuclease McrA